MLIEFYSLLSPSVILETSSDCIQLKCSSSVFRICVRIRSLVSSSQTSIASSSQFMKALESSPKILSETAVFLFEVFWVVLVFSIRGPSSVILKKW